MLNYFKFEKQMTSISDKLLINLQILSKIQKNGRICKSHNGLISLADNGIFLSLKRFFLSDSRQQSLYEINSIVNESILVLTSIISNRYMASNMAHTEEYKKLNDNLALLSLAVGNAKQGIKNLKFTYQDDLTISSQLDVTLLKIDNILKEVSSKVEILKSLQNAYVIDIKSNV